MIIGISPHDRNGDGHFEYDDRSTRAATTGHGMSPRVSDHVFARAIAQMAVPAMLHAESGEVLFVNQAWTELTGYAEADLPTIEAWTRLAYGDKHQEVLGIIQSLFEHEGRAANGEYEIRTASGEPRLWHFSSSNLGPDDRGRQLLLSTAVDVTDARCAERERDDANRRLVFSLEATGVGHWDLDLATDSATRSRRHDEIFGYETPPEAWGLEFFLNEHVLPSDRDRIRTRVAEAIAQRQPWGFECRIRRADGELRWIWAAGKVYAHADGIPRQAAGVVMDVTDQKETEERLRASEAELARRVAHLEAISTHAPAGLALFEAEHPFRVLTHNKRYQELWNEPYRSSGLVGVPLVDFVPDSAAQGIDAIFKEVAEDGLVRHMPEFQYDGMPRGRTWWNWTLTPLVVEGRTVALSLLAVDVTDNVQARRDLEREIHERQSVEGMLLEAETRASLAQRAGGVGTFEWDIKQGINRWSTELETLYGLRPGGFAGTFEAWEALVHPDDLPAALEAVHASFESGEFESEWRVLLSDGDERWLAARGWVEMDREGRPARMLGINIDITDRKEHESHLRTVMAELNHRVKNTLAVIQAIVRQTARRTRDPERFRESIERRLQSMAKAHSLLTKSEWKGATLDGVIRSELSARAATDGQAEISGPDVTLGPKATLALHMIVHELTTNALKYGGLRQGAGRVSARWELVPCGEAGCRCLAIDWDEHVPTGGVSPPDKHGYGSQLIDQLVAYELDATLDRSYEPNGLRCRIVIPLNGLEGSRPANARRDDTPPPRPSDALFPGTSKGRGGLSGPAPLTLLLVEDNAAIAMSLRDELRERGCNIIGPAACLEQGDRLAREHRCDGAVLDVDLGGENVFPLARSLKRRGVPVVFISGYNPADLPPDLQDEPMISKPIGTDSIAFVIDRLTARS